MGGTPWCPLVLGERWRRGRLSPSLPILVRFSSGSATALRIYPDALISFAAK